MTRIELELLASRQKLEIFELQRMLSERINELKTVSEQLQRTQHDFKALQGGYAYAKENGDKAIARSDADRRAREEALSQFDELKARLFAAETENHRLRGYIDRVREDDSVRDGFAVETEVTDRKMPLRVPAADIHTPRRSTNGAVRNDCQGERVETHWTSFGQRR